jgi:serine/threonine-protein kinase
MIGETISHYKIIEKLGEGGMGEVYLAEDTKLKRQVAIKFLPEHLTKDKENIERFKREAQATAALNHPNIVTIYDVIESDDPAATADRQISIVMEYVEGKSLRDVINEYDLGMDKIIDIICQISEGLRQAHKEGIVHRDVKPENIIVGKNARVRILDFGLAKLKGVSKLTKETSTLGTIHYMSPEQLQGKEVDQRSDIWALGVILYELLTGEMPFKGDYDQAILYSILNEEPETIICFRKECPTELLLVVERAMKKNQQERYKSCNILIKDLNSVKNNLGIERIVNKEKTFPSIAVLPFVNMSVDPENEYFSDGMSEDIINALSKIKDFHVAARTSTFSFKGEKIDVREIGKKLKVGTVLEGSVRKASNRLRITAQLINISDGYHLWSEQYDRVVSDVFDIQDEITLAIVNALKIELLAGENQAVIKKYTDNAEAYHLYLNGRYYWNKMNPDAFRKAIDFFNSAIQTDPGYALAYTGLADSYTGLGDAGLSAISPIEAFSKAKAAVKKALEKDETLAEAHASLGHLKMHDFDWSGAEQEFKRAIDLNPNYATTYHMSGFNFSLMERHDEAISTVKKALELDPVSLGIITDLGVIYYFARQYDKAIEQYQKALELDPGFIRVYVTLGSSYGQKGMYEQAIDMIQKAIDLSGDRAKIAALGRVYALSGKKAEAHNIIDELKELSKKRYISPYCLALIYASMDEKDSGMEYLNQAYVEHVSELIYLRVDPFLDKLRSDPRFKNLLKRVCLET